MGHSTQTIGPCEVPVAANHNQASTASTVAQPAQRRPVCWRATRIHNSTVASVKMASTATQIPPMLTL